MNAELLQFQLLLNFLFTPWGIIAMLAVPMLVMGLIASDRLKWIFVALLLWFTTFGYVAKTQWFDSVLVTPLQQLRGMAKGFCIVLLLMMLPAALFSSGSWRKTRVGIAVAFFFVFELIITTRQMGTGALLRSFMQLLLFTLLFVVLGLGLGHWLRQLDDVRKVFKAVSWAIMLLIAGSLIQVVVDSSQCIQNHRLFGTTNNPQFLGSILGMSITPVLYLLLTNLERPLWRLTLGASLGFIMICLVWTGSRTGFVMAAVNVLLFLRLRLGRIIAAVTVAGASFYLAMNLFPSSTEFASRLFSTADTRSAAFHNMIQNFLAHPFIGSIGEGFGFQENAYLAVAAQFGLLGLIPMVAVILAIGSTLRKVSRIRPQLGQHAGMADVVIGVTVSLAIGSCFDAYPLAAIGFHVFLLYIVLTIGEFLIDYVAATQSQDYGGMVSPDLDAALIPQAA